MAKAGGSRIVDLVKARDDILREWMRNQLSAERSRAGVISEEALREESTRFLRLFTAALERAGENVNEPAWDDARVMLADISKWGDFNEVYKTFFTGHFPARSALGTTGLALGAQVEVECMAYKAP